MDIEISGVPKIVRLPTLWRPNIGIEKILDKFSGVGKIPTPSGIQEARILINEGVHFFIMVLQYLKDNLRYYTRKKRG